MRIFGEFLQLGEDRLDGDAGGLLVVLGRVLVEDDDRFSRRDSQVDVRRVEQRLEDVQVVGKVVVGARVGQFRQQERPAKAKNYDVGLLWIFFCADLFSGTSLD